MSQRYVLPLFHIVREGESLREICARYGIRAIHVIEANPHKDSRIYAGTPVFVELMDGEEIALPRFAGTDL